MGVTVSITIAACRINCSDLRGVGEELIQGIRVPACIFGCTPGFYRVPLEVLGCILGTLIKVAYCAAEHPLTSSKEVSLRSRIPGLYCK